MNMPMVVKIEYIVLSSFSYFFLVFESSTMIIMYPCNPPVFAIITNTGTNYDSFLVTMVSLGSPADRVSILRALSATVSLGPDVDLETIGRSRKVRHPFFKRKHFMLCWCYKEQSRTSRQLVVFSVSTVRRLSNIIKSPKYLLFINFFTVREK